MSIAPRPPQYKGADLDAAKGPGLGCFWLQVAVLAVLVVITPLGVVAGWPEWLTVTLLGAIIVLLFFVGQTAIFLLRLVTAERRGRRRPLTSRTPTVGELEDRETGDGGDESAMSTGPEERPGGSADQPGGSADQPGGSAG